jgi:hypothetical protein
MIKLRNVFYLLLLALVCCKKPYNPPASSTTNSYLVVEGVINPGNDSTVIKVSRTVKLNDKIANNPVLGAVVTVESDQNSSVALYDINNAGQYSSPGLNLSASRKYRLRIKTTGGEYLSDFEVVKLTPPIDSVGYYVQNGIVNLYVNAHDATNSTRYYRYDYSETWAFHAKYESDYVLDPVSNTIQRRTADQDVYHCFGNDASSNIVLTSTEKLARDVVYQSPLIQIPLTSEKVETKYSIIVRQYALTPDAYMFYQNLKKNSEQLGSIFDAQPSQLSGNIHNVTNPVEPVVGYITVSTVQSKRIFIAHEALPGDVQPIYPYDCENDSALYKDKLGTNQVQNTLINPPIDYIPTSAITAPNAGIIGFKYSTIPCAECTVRGTTQTPAFWK